MKAGNLESSLKKIPFIADASLSDSELRMLGELCAYQAIEEGEVVFSQGDEAQSFFILLHGSVTVSVDDKPIATLGPGDHFGETALVINELRSATVKAMERCLLVHISKVHFGDFLQLYPALEECVSMFCKLRMLDTYRQMKVPFFSDLQTEKIKKAALECKFEFVEPGTDILTQGQPGQKFYVILSGEVRVITGTSEVVLKNGSYFGEISLVLEDQPCMATCRTASHATLLALDREAFLGICADEPVLLAYIHLKLLRTKCSLCDVLMHEKARGLFLDLLKKEMADEHLEFYDLAEKYTQIEAEEDRAVEAKRLWDYYVKDNAERQINIPDKQRTDICALLNLGKCNTDLFGAARQECYTLMSRDNF